MIEFFKRSYQSDKIAFFFEIVSTIFTVTASITLAVNAANPNMSIVYPGFFLGAVTSAYAYYRRSLAWPLLLTLYFAVINIIGFSRSMRWF